MATMSRKPKRLFVCSQCGAQSPQWAGQCAECGAWNSLVEERAAAQGPGALRRAGFAADSGIRALGEVDAVAEARMTSGFAELDRVLGGGLVSGAVVLIGGDPGIGKTTLLTQTLGMLAARGVATLYVTGEESLQQVGLRAQRLGLAAQDMRLLAETEVERILELAAAERPGVMVIDSVQTMFTTAVPSAPGSVSQVRESAARLVQFAKQTGTTLLLVGHVTKEGTLAGPRILEHMVDTVLYFEGDADSRYRVLRAVKNRFGAVNEMGVFAMLDGGLREVSNPSAIFLSRHERPVSGSAVMVTREGSRPLLVEVQALVAESHAANPRRLAVGLDPNRLAILLAVLQRHCGTVLYDQDVFVNVVGGVRVAETAVDLALALAILSSLRDRPLPEGLVVFGEVGLAGEIRPVQHGQERLREALQHGFRQALIPRANAPRRPVEGLAIQAVQHITEATGFL